MPHPSVPEDRRLFSTLTAANDDEWNRRVATPPNLSKRGRPRDMLSLWRASRGKDALILRGMTSSKEWYRDLVLALLVKLRRHRPRILMTDATWELGSAALVRKIPLLKPIMPRLARAAVRLVDGEHVTYGVLSSEEVSSFPRNWGIPPHRVMRMNFSHTLWGRGEHAPTGDDGYLFAGGNSLRDFDLLEQAVQGAPFDTVIASRWHPNHPSPRLKAESVPHKEFLRRLAFARATVVPMRSSKRSTGQQTYLNAMALGKPVIVTDSLGVRDYIEHGITGWIAPATAAGLREMIDFVMDERNGDAVRAVAENARRMVLAEYTEFTYRAQLLEWFDRTRGWAGPPVS